MNYGASKEVIDEAERLKKTRYAVHFNKTHTKIINEAKLEFFYFRTGKFVVKCFEEYRHAKLQV